MKLIAINQARAIWLFPLIDLNPRGKASEKAAFTEIAKRYNFTVSPGPVDVVVAREKNQPIKYLQGSFTPKKKQPVTVDMLIYRDGIVADTRSSTADSSEFIGDLLDWAVKEFELLPYEGIVKNRTAISEVQVSFDQILTFVNPKLNTFARLIGSNVAGHSGVQYELGGISFWTDQNLAVLPGPFRLERVAGAAFAENRYFSSAPMETEMHLDMLQRLEIALTS